MANRKRPRPQVSVIIVNYNVRDFLAHAIVSLQRSLRGIRSEIIVVDNASEDGSVGMMRRRFPAVRLLENRENVGFARANNRALRESRGDYILLINPDTLVQEDTVRVMLRFFATHPDAGLAGCAILSPDGSFQLSCRRSFPTPWVAFTKISGLGALFPSSRFFGRYNLTYRPVDQSYEVDAVSGSFMMLRREVYERVGGLDEDFFMYGEDLDWCYRVQKAGWRVFFVHETRIIHYKGESTRRSSIDEIETFYKAMTLFVEKHFRFPFPVTSFLKLGIAVTSLFASLRALVRPLRLAVVDILAVDISLLLAEYLWRGALFLYPSYAYPIVYVIPAVLVVGSFYALGVYSRQPLSVPRVFVGTIVSFVIISALTAFFKEYAFSRGIVVVSGALCLLLLPTWRVVFRFATRVSTGGRSGILGRRTLIIGTGQPALELLSRLRAGVTKGYEIVGLIALTPEDVGRTVSGVSVLGSLENVAKVIRENRISDLIFAPRMLSYAEILSVINKAGDEHVSFHLVPSTMEVIIGKASVDTLDEVPLLEISYNLDKMFYRFLKRSLDLLVSGLLLTAVYPILRIRMYLTGRAVGDFWRGLGSVFRGSASLVGPPTSKRSGGPGNSARNGLYIGKPGLTGLVQLQRGRVLTHGEEEQYNLYYARNQSVLLDVEILLKTWMDATSDSGGEKSGEARMRG